MEVCELMLCIGDCLYKFGYVMMVESCIGLYWLLMLLVYYLECIVLLG